MTFDKDERRRSREELVTVLTWAGGEGLQNRHILCPFHNDSVKSAEVKQSSNGYFYFACHKCGIAEDVWALQARVEGRDVAEILREAQMQASGAPGSSQEAGKPILTPKTSSSELQASNGPGFATIDDLISFFKRKMPAMVVEEVNPFTNPDTLEPDLYTIRYLERPGEKKKFIQATPAAGGWSPKGYPGDKLIPLFNRIGLKRKPQARVLLVEGEKKVRAVTELGIENLVAVSSCGGSKAARRCDWSPLAGRTVYIWADNDEVGRAFADEVAGYLKELNVTLFRVRESELDLPETGDVVEYIADNADDPATAIELVLFDAQSLGASQSLAQHFAKVAAGEHKLVDFINKPHLSAGTQAFLPGTVTLLVGEPEAAKSWWVLEEAWRQHEAGTKVRCMMLEDDHAFHMKRALAQMSGESAVLDHKHAEQNIGWVNQLFARYRTRLDSFGAVLEAGGSRERTIFEVADWVEKSAAGGARLIMVDPVTAASTGDMSWKDDRKFMMRVKFTAEKYGCSILLVSHPKLGKPGAPGLSGIAGGASYGRFSQTVLWLKKYPEVQVGGINDGYMTREGEYLRTIHVQKARNGRDGDKMTSRNIAVRLNSENLCFTELGMLI